MISSTVKISHAFFLLLSVGIIFLFWKIISPFILVLATAGVLVIVLSPLERRLRLLVKNRRLAALFMSVAVFFVIVAPLLLVAVIMIRQGTELATHSFGTDGWLRAFEPSQFFIFKLLPPSLQQEIGSMDIPGLIKGLAGFALQNAIQLFAGTARLVFNSFLFFVAFFYLLLERDRLYKEILVLSPLADRVDRQIIFKVVKTVRAVVFGSLTIALFQAILATVGMSVFGVPGAFIWGGLVIIAAQVPILGVGLIMIPAVLYLFLSGETESAIGLAVWSATAVGLIDNLVQPLLIGGKTRMHALLILIAILGGLQFFGPIGLILGPTVLASLLVLLELYKSGILEK